MIFDTIASYFTGEKHAGLLLAGIGLGFLVVAAASSAAVGAFAPLPSRLPS